MTLVPAKPKGGANKGSAVQRKAAQQLERSSIDGGIRLVLPAKGVNLSSKSAQSAAFPAFGSVSCPEFCHSYSLWHAIQYTTRPDRICAL